MLQSALRTTLRVKGRRRRSGTALVELGLLLPLFSFSLLCSTDFARVYHDYLTITDSSRNGALYASLNATQSTSIYQSGILNAALADVNGLSPLPTVTTATGTLAPGNTYVDVTVNYTFKTVANYPGIPSTVALSRTTRMRVVPSAYRMQ